MSRTTGTENIAQEEGEGGGGERGGVPKRAEEGETRARKRPSSLKYVPAGGNYAFNYLNE